MIVYNIFFPIDLILRINPPVSELIFNPPHSFNLLVIELKCFKEDWNGGAHCLSTTYIR